MILSYMIWIMSNEFREVTEYTRTKPWIPIACLELRIEYSSCKLGVTVSGRRACESEGGHTCLTSGVDDVAVILDALEVYALREGALDSRIIRLDEFIFDKLDDERGFTWVNASVL